MGPGLPPGKGNPLRGPGLLGAVFLLIALVLPLDAPGDLYRYVDEQGNLHISDRPPEQGRGKDLRVYRSPPAQPEPAPSEPGGGVHVVPFHRVKGPSGNVTGMAVKVTLTRGYRIITRPFVVDTGASATVITLKDMEELGIKPEEVTGSSVGVVPGGGRVLAHHVPLDELSLGELKVSNPSVAVIKGGADRLLGIDVLGRFDLEVKSQRGVLVLREKY